MSEETSNQPAVEESAVSTAEMLFGSDAPDHSEQEVVTPDPTPTVVEAPVQSESKPDIVQPAVVTPPVQPVAAVAAVQPQAVQAPVQPQAPVQQPVVQPPVQQQPAQQQAPAPKQLTQQEINQQLGVYTLTEKDYDAVFDTEDKQQSIKALDGILQKAVRQAVLMSKVLVERQADQINSSLTPYKQFADSYREQELQHNFYTSNPELKGQDELVKLVITQIQSEGRKFDNHQQVFDEVGRRTKAAIQQLAVGGQASQQPTVPVVAQKKPVMASLSRGGQAGQGGVGATKASGSNTAAKLFG